MSFVKDLADGEIWEYRVARAVSRELGYFFQFSHERAADILFLVPHKIEVKTDHMAADTGNAFLEYRNPRQANDSGLTLQEADIWLHCVPRLGAIFFFHPLEMLRHLALNKHLFPRTKGGDKNSEGFLIPLTHLMNLPFVQVIPLEPQSNLTEWRKALGIEIINEGDED